MWSCEDMAPGSGSGQVWPEVNVFLENLVFKICLTAALSSVTVRRGDSPPPPPPNPLKRTAPDAVTAQFPSLSLLLSDSFSFRSTLLFSPSRWTAVSECVTALVTIPFCPLVHKNEIVFCSFLLTPAQHINRAVICATTVSYREALPRSQEACSEKVSCYPLFTRQKKQYFTL